MGDISTYYKYLFPAELYVKWLNYDSLPDQRARHFKSKKSNLSYLACREFSMTLEGDIYIRYQTIDSNQGPTTQNFNSEADYLRYILLKKKPIKIDIGAIYNDTPVYKSSRHVQHELKGASVIPREKEICFDIDMTDYDPVRSCCQGADICVKCWPLMKIAAKIIEQALLKAFGLKNLLFVYSGRRGIHCWVCDTKARSYDPVVRSALAEYLQILKGSSGTGQNGTRENKRVKIFNVPEIINDSIEIINQYWTDYIVNQGIMESQRYIELTGFIQNPILRNEINQTLKNITSAESRLAKFEQMLAKSSKYGEKELNEIKLQFCYPRLDINVSKDLHHLLKSPFSIHPKTDRVCVPFDDVDEFDPFIVPTCTQICDEYNKGDKDRFGFDRCESFRGYVKTFETFLKSCLKDELEFNMKAGVADVKDEVKVKRQKMAGLEEVQDKENVKMEI